MAACLVSVASIPQGLCTDWKIYKVNCSDPKLPQFVYVWPIHKPTDVKLSSDFFGSDLSLYCAFLCKFLASFSKAGSSDLSSHCLVL